MEYKMKKLIGIYLIAVAALFFYGATSVHKGTMNGFTPYRDDKSFGEMVVQRGMAVIKDTVVNYDAASEVRCDSLYKYYHCIGYGYIQGTHSWNYFYNKNGKNVLITQDNMLRYYKKCVNPKIQEIHFRDVIDK